MDQGIKMTRVPSQNNRSDADRQDGNQGVLLRGQDGIKDKEEKSSQPGCVWIKIDIVLETETEENQECIESVTLATLIKSQMDWW